MAAKKKAEPDKKAKSIPLPMPKGLPTYPLSPSTLEIIVHAAHDGEKWIDLPKAAGKGIVLKEENEALGKYIHALNFTAKNPTERTITIHANAVQAEILEPMAHQLTVYLPSTEAVPEALSGAEWNPGKVISDPHLERKCKLIRPIV